MRTEGDLQVILRTVVEVNLVAGFQAQANWTPEGFDASPRIKSKSRIPGSDPSDRTNESSWHILSACTEVHKTDLPGYECANRSASTHLEFGSEQCRQGTRPYGCELGSEAVVER